ncbi:methyltransferase [Alteromonas sediminis]|uniref:Methyltransferase n=1 Tax=Alteromonas sediminis TaxID=2259342 RepID=A0A3N5YJQ8_9ALTE|nr:class I SAM-dependent methyltransferase [Alteromonas sediminis]RPJ64901.1 methyltransferase [Alteromonas sediminis]
MLMRHLSVVLGSTLLAITLSSYAGHHDMQVDKNALKQVVESRSADDKARDKFRHPAETLAFFKVTPGMTVAEALPGGGWYSKIIVNYLGESGTIYGVNYADDMWARFGFFTEEGIKERIASTNAFPTKVAELTNNGISARGFTFADVPDELAGTADRVLFIRALHNLSRFESEAGKLTEALASTHKLLKKGGMVGVVQHRIPESATEESASGDRGYLKQSFVIDVFEKAGFTLVNSSEINANPKDQPADTDLVWRLPPTYFQTREDTEKKAAVDAIGESDRMTLLFKKK